MLMPPPEPSPTEGLPLIWLKPVLWGVRREDMVEARVGEKGVEEEEEEVVVAIPL